MKNNLKGRRKYKINNLPYLSSHKTVYKSPGNPDSLAIYAGQREYKVGQRAPGRLQAGSCRAPPPRDPDQCPVAGDVAAPPVI